MPTLQDLEDSLVQVEAYFIAQIPIITHSIQRLGDDLRRFGPPELPEIPAFPLFASTPPLPPLPPLPAPEPLSYSEHAVEWAGKHRTAMVGAGALIGSGIALGGFLYWRQKSVRLAESVKGVEVVVILGADSPLGQIVAVDLLARGYVVVASVASPESIHDLEKLSKGYLKALVLDPQDPSSITPFMHSLQSTLSLKFPLAPGDPYRSSSLSELPRLVSLISLLSLAAPIHPMSTSPPTSDSESASHTGARAIPSIATLSISRTYLPYLITTHLTPLTIIQSILQLFRSTNKRQYSSSSIIIALPGGPTSAGVVGQDPSPAMASAAMAKGAEILRRELASSEGMGKTRVVVIDIGEITTNQRRTSHSDRRWSHRKPTDARCVSDAIARVVTAGTSRRTLDPTVPARFSGNQASILITGLALLFRDWWRGDRFSVGAGAGTYALAAYLPLRVLDTLMVLPQTLLRYRDDLKKRAREVRRQARDKKHRAKEQESRAESDPQTSLTIIPRVVVSPNPIPCASEETASSETSSLSPPPSESEGVSEVDAETFSLHGSQAGDTIAESWVMDVDGTQSEREGH